jgi:RNA-directed DNA polymerase
MQDRKDVAEAIGLTEKSLCYFLYKKQLRKQYRNFDLPKRSGGIRVVSAPPSGLLALQRSVYRILLELYQPKACAHGFIPNRGIVTNALPHARRRLIANIDLRNFFPSIYFGRVRGVFLSRPFWFGDEAATVLAQIACMDNGLLPQGGALSPIVSNLVCRGRDNELVTYARNYGLRYTRYADDITFSTKRPSFPEELIRFDHESVFPGPVLEETVKRHSFEINKTKLKYRSRSRRQEVTGLTVNEFPNVPRNFVREISGALHAWNKYGYACAQEMYESTFRDSGGEHLNNVLRGRLAYLKMVRGRHDFIFRRLARQFNRLDQQPIPIDDLIDSQPTGMHNLPCAWNQWVRKYSSEVFMLSCSTTMGDTAHGTAFHVGGGLLATARHCVFNLSNAVHADLRLHVDGTEKPVDIIRSEMQTRHAIDVAALRLDELSIQRGIPTQLRLPEVGEEVAAIGFPSLPQRNSTLVVHVGTVEALPTSYTNQQRFVQVSFQSGGGLSGGCLIDKSGHVVGIMVENVFVKARDIGARTLAAAARRYELDATVNSAEEIQINAPDSTSGAQPSTSNGSDHKSRADENSPPERAYSQASPIEYFDSFLFDASVIELKNKDSSAPISVN